MSTIHLRRPSRARRTLTGATVATLAAATLTLAPASAHAADISVSKLQWNVSEQFMSHLSTRTFDGGAVEHGSSIYFVNGEVTEADADGITVEYDGTVRGAFENSGTEFYQVTVKDPIVTLDADGHGAISAIVSSSTPGGMGNPPGSTSPARVTVTEFTADRKDSVGRQIVTATPEWAGVLDAAQATTLGIAAGKPLGGKSFHADFLGQLVTSLRAHFYASGSGSDPKKAPAKFSASTETDDIVKYTTWHVDPVITATTAPFGQGTTVAVAVDQRGSDVPSGDVTLGGLGADQTVELNGSGVATFTVPATTSAGSKSLSATYAGDANYAGGTVTGGLTISKAPVTINNTVTTKPTTKKSGTTKVTVRSSVTQGAAAGRVKVYFKKSGKATKSTSTATLQAGGTRSITVPKLAKGTWKIYVTYTGTSSFASVSQKSLGTVKVTK